MDHLLNKFPIILDLFVEILVFNIRATNKIKDHITIIIKMIFLEP